MSRVVCESGVNVERPCRVRAWEHTSCVVFRGFPIRGRFIPWDHPTSAHARDTPGECTDKQHAHSE